MAETRFDVEFDERPRGVLASVMLTVGSEPMDPDKQAIFDEIQRAWMEQTPMTLRTDDRTFKNVRIVSLTRCIR